MKSTEDCNNSKQRMSRVRMTNEEYQALTGVKLVNYNTLFGLFRVKHHLLLNNPLVTQNKNGSTSTFSHTPTQGRDRD